MNKTLKRTNIGHSKSVEALMVRIDWTSAKVVRIEARQDFEMDASTVKVLHDEYSVMAHVSVSVKAGQVLYFVQSKDFAGWYYVLVYNGVSFGCSCPGNYHFHKTCEHQQHAMVFVGHRYANRVQTEHFIDPDMEAHVEDELAAGERQYENLCSAAA